MDRIDISENKWTQDRFGSVNTEVFLDEGYLAISRNKIGYRTYQYDISIHGAHNMELSREHRITYHEDDIEQIANQLNRTLDNSYSGRHQDCIPEFNQKNCYCNTPMHVDLIYSTEVTTEIIINSDIDYKHQHVGEPSHCWSPNFCPVCGKKWNYKHSLQLLEDGNIDCHETS